MVKAADTKKVAEPADHEVRKRRSGVRISPCPLNLKKRKKEIKKLSENYNLFPSLFSFSHGKTPLFYLCIY